MNKKKQSARIKDLKAENYDLRKENHGLRFENEFLKNRIAIIESNKGFEVSKIKSLTKEEQIELLEKVRAFKTSVMSFVEESKNNKKEEKKEIKLVRGEVYWCKGGVFRFSCIVKMPCTHNSEGCYHKVGYLHFNNRGVYDTYFANEYWFDSINYATEEEKAIFVKSEEENGKFWNDEKQDYLKLEDVCYKAKTRQELLDIANSTSIDNLSNGYDTDIKCPYVKINSDSFILNSNTYAHRIEVTKEVFIKLLKNYKG